MGPRSELIRMRGLPFGARLGAAALREVSTNWFYLSGRPTGSPRSPRQTRPQLLSIPERVLLFCVASDTDWEHAGITGMTAMIVRGLIRCDPARRLRLTNEGHAVLAALLAKGG